MTLKINEAIGLAQSRGHKILQEDIGLLLWPKSTPATRKMYANRLINGKYKKVDPEWIVKIAELCGCTTDFLLK